jgi:hypothetical protein
MKVSAYSGMQANASHSVARSISSTRVRRNEDAICSAAGNQHLS